MGKALFIQLSRLGDNLQSTPLLASWRLRFPEDRITVLTRAAYAPVYEGNDDVDEIRIYSPGLNQIRENDRNPIARLDATREWLESLCATEFDSVVNLTHDPLSCWVAHTLNAPCKRGVAMDSLGTMRAFDPWSVYLFSLLHYRHLNLFNLCDIYAHLSGAESSRKTLRFILDESSRARAREWLGESTDPLVGFQPGASKAERRWPAENFIRLGNWLRESFSARVLVFGSDNERPLADAIAAAIPEAVSFAGKTTIRQLGALLDRCRVLVTNDTGTMHLATAVGTTVVALFEASAYLRETGPYGEGHWVLQSRELKDHEERNENDLSQLDRIPVEEVQLAVTSILRGSTTGEIQARPASASRQVDHFRSSFTSSCLDFFPVFRRPIDAALFWAHLQRPVWLSSLGGPQFDVELAARSTLEHVREFFAPAEIFEPATAVVEGIEVLSVIAGRVLRMKNLIQSALKKLARNRNYLIPQNQVAELTELENRILELGDHLATKPFIAYFETGLAMINGEDTSKYLHNYLQPVLQLSRQLQLYLSLLHSVRQRIGSSHPDM